MANVNNRYQEALFRHATGIEGFEAFLVDELVQILNETEIDLMAQVRERLEQLGPGSRSPSQNRLKRLESSLKRIKAIRTAAWIEINQELRKELRDLANVEVDFTREAFANALQLEEISLVAPAAPALRAATFDSPFRFNSRRSMPLANWMASLRQGDLNRLEQAIRIGFLEGEDIDSIVRRIRGTRPGKFKDGLLQLTRLQTETVVRTSVNHFANAARATTWEANTDVILGLRWTSVLDGRTTPICQARDGDVSPLGDNVLPPGMTLLNPPNARPPAHAQCRSIMVAIVSPEGVVGRRPFVTDIRTGKKREIDFRKMARTQGRSVSEVRAEWAKQRVGTVPAETTYDTFLRKQSAKFQDEVLGPKRGKLFREGNLGPDDFVRNDGRRYTLSELRRRDAEAFRKAGL